MLGRLFLEINFHRASELYETKISNVLAGARFDIGNRGGNEAAFARTYHKYSI